MKIFLSVAVFLGVCFVLLAGEVITTSQAIQYAGTNQTVSGRVVSVRYAAGSKGKPTFLNLDKPYPQQIFTVVIWGSDRSKFPEPPEKLYHGKKIRVTGLIKVYKGIPEITVSSPQQIEVEETSGTR